MADDITLPGTGVKVDTREQPDGSHQQVVQVEGELAALASSINTLVQFIYNNMPRLDGFKRAIVNNSETTQPISGTLTTVTTVTTVSNVANQTLLGGYSPANERFMQLPMHIYNAIDTSV